MAETVRFGQLFYTCFENVLTASTLAGEYEDKTEVERVELSKSKFTFPKAEDFVLKKFLHVFFFFFNDLRVLSNLVPRVLRLFGQREGARRDSGKFEKISIF